MQFAEEFSKLLGKFIFCLNKAELAISLQQLIQQKEWSKIYCCEKDLTKTLQQNGFNAFADVTVKDCDASITSCEFLVARTGSIIMSAAQESGRTVSVYAPVHICIATTSQLVYDIKDGLNGLKEKYRQYLPSLITFATGPSRTADIEKTLVVGVHGPKEVYCFVIDDHQ